MHPPKNLKLPKIQQRCVIPEKSIDLNETVISKDIPTKIERDANGKKTYKEIWMRLKTKVLVHIYLRKLLKNLKIFGPSTSLFANVDLNSESYLTELHAKGLKISDAAANVYMLPRGILHPNSVFLSIWNLLMILVLFYIAIISPFMLAFHDEVVWDSYFTIDVLIDFFFLADLFLTFSSAYYNEENQLVHSRKEIAWNYAKGWLVLDSFSSMPFGLIQAFLITNQSDTSRLFRLSRIPKLMRLSRLIKMMKNLNYFESIDFIISVNQRVIRFIRVLTGIGVSLHVAGCLWHVTARFENYSPNTWVFRYGYLDSDIWERYLVSLYWALTTLTTVGYGDITPYTTSEKILSMFWMIMAVYFISFSVGSLSSMLSQQYTKEKIINDKLILADEYKKINQISLNVAHKMKRSIRAYTDFACFSSESRAELLDKLPIKLRYEIALDMHNGVISQFPFFSIREDSFVGSIAPYLDYYSYDKHQSIWIPGEPAVSIYFIIKGRVDYLINKEDSVFRSFNDGHYFGDNEVLHGKVRNFSVQSGTLLNVLIMHQSLIFKIERNFPLIWNDMKKITHERERKLFLSYAEGKAMQRIEGSKDENFLTGKEVKVLISEELEKIQKSQTNQEKSKNIEKALDEMAHELRFHTEAIRRIEGSLGKYK